MQQSGNQPDHHFAGAGKPIAGGKGAVQVVQDYHLSRFACYLIAQNGDPRKPEIAQAQKYFAIQARRQELTDQLAADMERLEIRKQTTEEFKALSGAAQQAGVQNRMFGVFHDAGYKGLYGGLGNDDIKARKGIPGKENFMDRMNATELQRASDRRSRRSGRRAWIYLLDRRSRDPSNATCPAVSVSECECDAGKVPSELRQFIGPFIGGGLKVSPILARG